jgi:hypothetical protein
MTDLELIFSMLGEASTTEITRTREAQGFVENKAAAQKGGAVAGSAHIFFALLSNSCYTTTIMQLPSVSFLRFRSVSPRAFFTEYVKERAGNSLGKYLQLPRFEARNALRQAF